ncbi:MAG: RpiB/LacA/LacB family sugar-phosphate isomerase [Candidatus Paceibacterota bacterium]|jgi:ribose 5-phosphate isomerase B
MDKKIIIYLGADHAGFYLKEKVKKYLVNSGYSVLDFGALSYDKDDDFPDFFHPLASKFSKNINNRALIFGGSGMGESIVLNRYKRIRCGIWYGGNKNIVKNYREHDDINSLAIASRFIDKKDLFDIIDLFLKTKFLNKKRYCRRVSKIDYKK